MGATKTWGPFTGRQLTIIILALCATVVLMPAAAFGVAKAKGVFVVDAVSQKSAGVDAAGKLKIGDGVGNLTVDGNVTSSAAPAANFFRNPLTEVAGACEPIATPPPGKSLVLQTLNFAYRGVTSGTNVNLFLSADGTCGPGAEPVSVPIWYPQANGSTTLPLAPGIVVPAGKSLLGYHMSGTGSVWVTALGYSF